MKWKEIARVVLLAVLITSLMAGAGLAKGKVRGVGVLTSIEEDGSIIIDEKGYDISPSARILNGKGEKTSLHRFLLPAKVDFEYEYRKEGFVIIFIQEHPGEVPQ